MCSYVVLIPVERLLSLPEIWPEHLLVTSATHIFPSSPPNALFKNRKGIKFILHRLRREESYFSFSTLYIENMHER